MKEISNEGKIEIFDKLGGISEGNDGRLIKDENEEVIIVSWSTYLKFFRKGGNWCLFVLLQVLMLGFTVCKILTDYAIGNWVEEPTAAAQRDTYAWYVSLSFSYVSGICLCALAGCAVIFFVQIRASRKIHQEMVDKLLKAPINLFFDMTPVGTIMNRFSKDL